VKKKKSRNKNSERKPTLTKRFRKKRRNVKRSLFQKHTRKLHEYDQTQRDEVLASLFNFPTHPPLKRAELREKRNGFDRRVFGNLPTLPNNLTSWGYSVLPASGRILY
jgi:hypothetical protein